MKTTSYYPFLLAFFVLTFGIHSLSSAQLRENMNNSSALTGPVVKSDPSEGANLGNLFNMKMDHSYSMMFSSFGGQMQNMNAYTNTMRFFFTENLTGRVDLSLLHSPFGGSSYMSNNNGGMNTELIIRNAELNYQLSENSNIRVQFQQLPNNYYGISPWGMRRAGYGYGFQQQRPNTFD